MSEISFSSNESATSYNSRSSEEYQWETEAQNEYESEDEVIESINGMYIKL